MPRPNAARLINRETQLADRIAYERERRGWSYDGLATRLTQVGCPIQSSAIYKIEKGHPRRRITVDEQCAFAEVFGVGVEDLLLSADAVKDRDFDRATAEIVAAEEGLFSAVETCLQVRNKYVAEADHDEMRLRAIRLFVQIHNGAVNRVWHLAGGKPGSDEPISESYIGLTTAMTARAMHPGDKEAI